MLRFVSAAFLASLAVAPRSAAAVGGPAPHEGPHAFCARVVTDDTLRPTPPSLAAAIRELFGFGGPNALRATYYRCAGGDVMVCAVGANLPCDKANTDKNLPAAQQWCRTHAGSDFIPAYVVGHDTPYAWRCAGGKAEAGAPVGALDDRGFFADYWKIVR